MKKLIFLLLLGVLLITTGCISNKCRSFDGSSSYSNMYGQCLGNSFDPNENKVYYALKLSGYDGYIGTSYDKDGFPRSDSENEYSDGYYDGYFYTSYIRFEYNEGKEIINVYISERSSKYEERVNNEKKHFYIETMKSGCSIYNIGDSMFPANKDVVCIKPVKYKNGEAILPDIDELKKEIRAIVAKEKSIIRAQENLEKQRQRVKKAKQKQDEDAEFKALLKK